MAPVPAFTLRQLDSFVTTCSSGSISRAAATLFVSQPALSRQMVELERACGTPLFERVPSGIRLTAAGAALLPHAVTMLRLAEEVPDIARSAGSFVPAVSIGLATGLPHEWLAELLGTVAAMDPAPQLTPSDGTSSEHTRAVREGRLDLALVHESPPEPLVGQRLRSDRLGVALRPDVVPPAGTAIRVRALDGLVVLAHSRDQVTATHDRIVAAADEAGSRPIWRFCAYTDNAFACAVATGAVASLHTEASARRLLPGWRWFPLADPVVRLDTWLIRLTTTRSAVQRTAEAMVLAHAGAET